MSFFKPATSAQINASLLLLRVFTGLTLAAHGWQKVVTTGMGAVAGNFEKMGIPLASVAGPMVSLLELVGGVAVAVGLLTRPFALLLAVDMLGAALLVHRPNGFFGAMGMELTLLFATNLIALAIAGAGEYSLDSKLGNKSRQ